MESASDRLRAQIAAHKGQFKRLEKASGVPLSTIYKIHGGFIKNTGIDTASKLQRGLQKLASQ